MTSLKVKLNKCRESKSGQYPLVVQLIHRRSRRMIPTGIRIIPELFDEKKQQVKFLPGYKRKDIRKINETISDTRRLIEAHIDQLWGKEYTAEDIAMWYKRKINEVYLFSFAEKMIDEKRMIGKFGTASAYIATIHSIRNFLHSDNLKFTDITYSFLKNYEQHLRMQGVAVNTVAYYMRNLRTLYNCALRQCVFVLPVNGSPFGIYKIQSSATSKRALNVAQLRAIAATDLRDSPMLELARDVFMASFYLRGIPFVDLVHLTRDNIRNGHICYSRRKTGALLTIEIIPALQKLIDKYASSDGLLFPFLKTHAGNESMYKQYRNRLIGYNRCLKKVGERAGLTVPLTSYVARHSWATSAKEKGASAAIISEGLGHSSEQITRTYLKNFECSVIDRVNALVANLQDDH